MAEIGNEQPTRPYTQPAQPDITPAPGIDPVAEDPARELARLRLEVSALQARLDRSRHRTARLHGFRDVAAALLTAVTACCLVASVVGLWAANTVLRTDRWVATVAPLPKDPKVATAVAQYATSQIFRVVNVEQRLREVLPEQAGFAAAPITGQVRGYVQRTVETVIRSDRFQQVWIEINRRAHRRALAVLEGRSELVRAEGGRAEGGRIVVDLLPLINQALRELSAQLPTLFGRHVELPDLSDGSLPPRLRDAVQQALGVPLPADFARFTIDDRGRLASLQLLLLALKRDLMLLVGAALITLPLAFALSRRRLRSLLQLGLWLVVAAIATTAGLRAGRADLLSRVPAGSYRDGVAAAITTLTRLLHERGVQLIWLGALLAAVAYLAGPGRVPVRVRHGTATAAVAAGRHSARWVRAAVAYGPAWLGRRREALRVAGIVVAGVVALALSSWSGLLVVAVVLAGYELLVTVLAARRP